jgi:hypothetical protein
LGRHAGGLTGSKPSASLLLSGNDALVTAGDWGRAEGVRPPLLAASRWRHPPPGNGALVAAGDSGSAEGAGPPFFSASRWRHPPPAPGTTGLTLTGTAANGAGLWARGGVGAAAALRKGAAGLQPSGCAAGGALP